jgi:hypothetical protein
VPAETVPRTVPSALRSRNAFSLCPVKLASEPAPVALPRPKNMLTAVPAVVVHVHVLPLSVDVTVFVEVAPVSVNVAVAGAHVSEPRSPLFGFASDWLFVIVGVNVPVPRLAFPAAVPEAVADAPAKRVKAQAMARAISTASTYCPSRA